MPHNVKMATMVNEAIRRLRNTSRSIPWSLKAQILTKFANDLRVSGYNQQFREKVIQSAIIGFRRQCEAADNGGTPLHRPRSYNREERRKKKLLSKTSWFRPSHDVVAFFPATEGSWLVNGVKKIMREEGERIGFKIKVVEKSGTPLASLLSRPDLSGCLYPDCRVEGMGASHTRLGTNYTGTCTICDKRYRGETGFNAHARIDTHEREIRGNVETNSMARHLEEEHPARRRDPTTFTFTVERAGERPLTRQRREAQKIANEAPGMLINGRNEHIPPAIRPMAPGHLLDGDAMRDQTRRTGR